LPPTTRAHPIAYPTPLEVTSQPFSHLQGPRGRLAGTGSQAQASRRRLFQTSGTSCCNGTSDV